MSEAPKQKKPAARRVAEYLLLALMILAVLPVLALKSHRQFLPSPEWLSRVGTGAILLGVLLGGASTWLWVKNIRSKEPEMSDFKFLAVLLFLPFFGYFVGAVAVQTGLPMLAAMVAGAEVEIPYRVAKYEGGSDRKCPHRIRLMGMPFMFDNLCGLPETFGQSFQPGDKILIKGWGRAGLGVFPKSARRMDDVQAHGGN